LWWSQESLDDQGGSVARALLDDGRWRVRGLTRNADSEKANELRSQGV